MDRVTGYSDLHNYIIIAGVIGIIELHNNVASIAGNPTNTNIVLRDDSWKWVYTAVCG